jgi:hypothetical protein
MSDLDRELREAARRYEPPPDWFERIQARAKTKRRNQRILAATVGASLSIAIVITIVSAIVTSDPPTAGGPAADGETCRISVRVTNRWRWEGSGTDDVGNQDAELHGDATFAPGFIGDALTLDGDGDFASVPDDPAIDVGTGDYTLLLWVNFSNTDRPQVLVEKWVQRERRTSLGWTFQMVSDGSIAFFSREPDLWAATQQLTIQPDTWLHFAVRREGNTLTIFRDGVEVATGRGPDADLDSRSSLKFGHRGGDDDTPGATLRQEFFLSGQLDEIQLSVGRALSDEAILRIYETQLACAT